MLDLIDHELRERIYESQRTVVYRGRKRDDGSDVIVKTHRTERPLPATIARLRREYAMGTLVEGPGVIRYLAVETQGGSVAVVSEDFGGVDLRTQLPLLRGDVEAFLDMAVQLADGVSAIHVHNIIHKDIKAGNIVVNPATRRVKLIDFGLASEIIRERQGPVGPAQMEGTIAYMSPEQTGRMNRTIDHRADLYSLGVTFYEMLCGRPPFPGNDPLELIHCHIAKHPTPPHQVDPRIPRVLSNIIMKLLAKNAEERYQTARGLRVDLLRCQQSLSDSGRIADFELGSDDRSGVLQVSQRLYGRERHKSSLLEAFERASEGGRELVLVGGPGGVGKSSLIAEMHRPMTERWGYFISGKGDVLGRNVPYSVLLQACDSLLKEILTESELRLERWRGWLRDALGANAGLITEVLPALELIIGAQPLPAQVSPAEAQRRFDQTFFRFVGVFARPEYPLVMFLDDLQWADSATFRVLRQLLTVSDSTHLLVVGAYRNDDVSRSQALMLAAAEIREAGGVVSEIELDTLGSDDVTQLVADTLGCGPDRARPLAELVYDKTLGNPFFIGELLRTLHADGQLWLEDGEWRWDEDHIRAQGVSANVVGLLVDKVRLLSDSAQQSLRLAACMGTTFALGPLARVRESSIEEAAQRLKEAIRVGLVQPLGQLYKQAELGMDEGGAAEYRFTHERVREAAYSLLPAEERPAVHWRVGKILLQDTPEEQREARIFDIVNQLDQGMELAKERTERAWLAGLNLQAGQRAAESMAHDSALTYLGSGIELLGDDGFTHEYELALALHTEACKAAQASDDLVTMDRYADLVLANAVSLLDKLPVHEARISAYIAKRELARALALGLEVLDSLGTRFPAEPGPDDVQAPLMDAWGALAGYELEELVALPVMDDPEKRAAMRIMVTLATPIYIVKPLLYPLITAEMIKLTLEYGNAPESALGYSYLGVVCCSDGIAQYQAAQRFGQLALLLTDRFGAEHLRPNVMVAVYSNIKPWADPLGTICAPMRVAARLGLSNGNLEYGGHALHLYGLFALASGQELGALEAEMAIHIESLARVGQETSINWMKIHRQTMRTLLGLEDVHARLRGDAPGEGGMSLARAAEKGPSELCLFRLDSMILSYLFRDYERALEHADACSTMVALVQGTLYVPLFFSYDALIRLAMAEDATEEKRAQLLEQVAADQAKLRLFTDAVPVNHHHRSLLVEAERHRLEGRLIETIEAYDEAIAQATSNGFHNDAALANERAAEFWLARNKLEIATAYAHAARYEYERWGAKAKVADLEDRYRSLASLGAPAGGATVTETVSSDTLGLGDGLHLDMGSVFKATRVLSEEMDVRQVVTSLMTIVIENAGAHRGYLLLDEAGTLSIQASGSIDDDTVVVERSKPGAPRLELGQVLSEAIVRYVVRTGTPVVLHDAVNSGMFTRDPHVRRTGVRSVLCMPFSAPMVSRHSAAGVLYLENSDTANAFSHDRVRVLKLITAQAAISLENARLYGDLKKINATLEELVTERTKELRDAQRALVRASRKVGQAEVAENLLHNAGNLLNSLTVSSGILRDAVNQPVAQMLAQLVERLRSPTFELSEVFVSTEPGALLLKLLGSVGDALAEHEEQFGDISNEIGRVVGEFVQLLRKHDEYLTEDAVVQAFLLGTLLDDALASSGVGQRPWLRLRKDYGRHPLLHNDQYGLERLLVTLLRHLAETAATATAVGEPATLSVVAHWTGREIVVVLGLGEASDDRAPSADLFQQRSTSHPDMPSLHDCANTAAKLGGTLNGYVGDRAEDIHFVLTLGVRAPHAGAEPAE
ncbi:protein kinase domain-containing protein [Haliangium sp.]|uniref:protein kinase domain-containing protein n=1 Tax=Haliangium sp. TaxID=2663208 RepID=UPI003D13D302